MLLCRLCLFRVFRGLPGASIVPSVVVTVIVIVITRLTETLRLEERYVENGEDSISDPLMGGLV